MTAIRIANHLSPRVAEWLRAHPSRPDVLEFDEERPKWDIPDGAEVLVTAPRMWEDMPDGHRLPDSLRWVQSLSAGIEKYPEELLRNRVVTCGRGLTAVQIAEYVLTAILQDRKPLAEMLVPNRTWSEVWDKGGLPPLAGQTVGLIGFGAINQEVARRAAAFDMRLVATRRGDWTETPEGIEIRPDAQSVAAEADYMVLAVPLTPETQGMIGAEVFAAARPGLHLINVARGGLVDQDALLAALGSGQIRRATLDVTDPEPLPDGHPLYSQAGVTITPHISWMGGDEMGLFRIQLMANLDRWLAGGTDMLNQVDPARGY